MLNIIGILLGCGAIGLLLIAGLAVFYALLTKMVLWVFSKLIGKPDSSGRQ